MAVDPAVAAMPVRSLILASRASQAARPPRSIGAVTPTIRWSGAAVATSSIARSMCTSSASKRARKLASERIGTFEFAIRA